MSFLKLASIIGLICVAVPGLAQDDKAETIVAGRADLQVVIEADGTLEPLKRKKLRILPDEFAGPYTVTEIVPSGQAVEAGAILARMETATLERWIRGGQEALDAAKAKLQTTRDELDSLKTGNRLKLERMDQDLKQAERDVKVFEKFGDEQWMRGKELAIRQNQHYQENREQELSQLEKMYKDAQLSSDTKEIVLQRARRDAELGREGLALLQKTGQQLKEFDYPTQKEKLARAIEQKKQDIDLVKAGVRTAEAQKGEEMKAAERAVRDNDERMARLRGDMDLLTVKAPFAGVFRHSGIEVGDKVGPNAVFAEVLETTHFEIRFLLGLRELQAVHPGDSLKVKLPEIADAEVDGKIEEVALTASPDDKGGPPRYLVRAKLDDNKTFRHGARGRAEIRGEKLKKVIAIPRRAIFAEDGKTFCRVRADAGVTKRELTVGLGDREQVQVVRGLSEGEIVIVKEAKETK
ncbi:MAG TPA: HlyD family efflux transporter periplasmic adaptor subunit [Planctomycetota bacterium]|jgi:multidrug resistance efflux pump